MKKLLTAAILAVSFLISVPQVSADDVVSYYCAFCHINIQVPSTVYPNDGWKFKTDCPARLESLRQQLPGSEEFFRRIYQEYPEYRHHIWAQGTYTEPPPKTPEQIEAEKREAAERAERLKREAEERKAAIKAEIERRAKIREESKPTIAEADAIFKTKNYTASAETYRQAIAIDPYNGYTHYMLAKSLYRDKTNKNKDYDLIIGEVITAMTFNQSDEELADYYAYLGKIYLKLGWKNLFNTDNNFDYSGMSIQCTNMANQLRQRARQQKQNNILGGLFK